MLPGEVWSWAAFMLEQTGALRFTAGWNLPTAQVSGKLGKCFSQEGDAKDQSGTGWMAPGLILLEHPESPVYRTIYTLGWFMALPLQVRALQPLRMCFPPHYVAPGFSLQNEAHAFHCLIQKPNSKREHKKKKLPNICCWNLGKGH